MSSVPRVSQRLSKDVQCTVSETRRLPPGSPLNFPFSLVPTFTLVENAFGLLVDSQIRSGDGQGGAALEEASGPEGDS